MTTAVTFESVTFSYPDASAHALEDVSLDVPEGAFVLVAGATGAGKSTLLRAVNGLVPHFTGGRFRGRVVVAGRDTRLSPPRRLADVVAFVPQEPGSAFVVDRVEDELAYAMENLGLPSATMRRRVEEALDLLDLAAVRARSVRTLSGGERQRVAIAAALAAGPRVVVLDEPTSQLDPQGAEDVLAALQRLVHDLGMTVIAAEHRLERIAGFADWAVGLRGARPVVAGPPAPVLDEIGSGPVVAELGRILGWTPLPLTVRDARRRAGVLPGAPFHEDARAGDVILEARGLWAAYGGPPVLRAVDLELREGEVVAIVGRNGSGKTTLLRCLCGLHELSRGDVDIHGRGPAPGTSAALCPQTPEHILFRDTVALEIAASIGSGAGDPRVRQALAHIGIGRLATRHPRDLSAGERLLVAVAAIAVIGAPVLLLDEPTRGADVPAKRRLAAFLRSYARAGRAVALVTHDVELAAAAATRVVMLAGGEVIADGSPADVLGDSPVFAPQTARVFGPGWLTPEHVARAVAAR